MNKVLLSLFLLFFLTTSCRKTLDPINGDGKISFFIRLPSLTIARFEAKCNTEDIYLDQVRIQSPSGGYFTEDFSHHRIAKNEIFTVGNQDSEDGLWLITFIGSSAITNSNFQQIVPYEMVISTNDDGQ